MALSRYVLRSYYGGRFGRQQPDPVGRRYRIVNCRSGKPETECDWCDWWAVWELYPGTSQWSRTNCFPTLQAALDRVAYLRIGRNL